MILGIDPGIDTGWATIVDGRLTACSLGMPPTMRVFDGTCTVFIERPQVYKYSKGDPNDLITLAIQVGRYVECYSQCGLEVKLVLPHAWKGNTPKDITKARMSRKYPNAKTMISKFPCSKQHNVWDAIGIADYGASKCYE